MMRYGVSAALLLLAASAEAAVAQNAGNASDTAVIGQPPPSAATADEGPGDKDVEAIRTMAQEFLASLDSVSGKLTSQSPPNVVKLRQKLEDISKAFEAAGKQFPPEISSAATSLETRVADASAAQGGGQNASGPLALPPAQQPGNTDLWRQFNDLVNAADKEVQANRANLSEGARKGWDEFRDMADKGFTCVNPVASNSGFTQAMEYGAVSAKYHDDVENFLRGKQKAAAFYEGLIADLRHVNRKSTAAEKQAIIKKLEKLYPPGRPWSVNVEDYVRSRNAPQRRDLLKRIEASLAADTKAIQSWDAKLGTMQNSKLLGFFENPGMLADVTEVLSNVAGAAQEGGDEFGPLAELISGSCKVVAVGWAGAKCAAAGMAVAGPPGAVVAGIAGAAAADVAYNETALPYLFGPIRQAVANYEKARKLNIERYSRAYGDIKASNGRTFEQNLSSYMLGTMKEKEFKALNDGMRENVLKRNAELKQAYQARRQAFIAELRGLEAANPELKPLVDAYENPKRTRGDIRRLKDFLLKKRAETCGEKAAQGKTTEALGTLGHKKVQKVFEAAKVPAPTDFYGCLCSTYSFAGTGFRYSPAADETCRNQDPCKGGNWGCTSYDLPSGGDQWTSCMGGNRVFVVRDASGAVLFDGARIDQVVSGEVSTETLAAAAKQAGGK